MWPALWAFLLGVIILGAAGSIDVSPRDIWSPLIFLSDYVNPDHVSTFHTWSLAIEEQFYLLWPLALLRLGRRARPVLAVGIVLAPFVRAASYVLIPAWRGHDNYQFHQRYDVLAMGCLLALLWTEPRLQAFLSSHGRLLLVAAPGLLVLNAAVTHEAGSGYGLFLGQSVQSLCFTAFVASAVASAPAALNNRPARHLGLISYSLYLWQQPATLAHIHGLDPWVGLGIAIIASEASYRLIERPLEPVRRRLHREQVSQAM